MSRLPRAIDLFSGCGGLTHGLTAAGFHVIGAVEIDAKARETYSLNNPLIPFVGTDIRKIDAAELMRQLGLKKGEIDLLAGCPPCQGFSTLRARSGHAPANDNRNDLVDDFARLAKGLKPKLVMMENVPALIKYGKFLEFVSWLQNNKYQVNYEIVDVSAYGVPQRRKRLILSASRVGELIPAVRGIKKVSVRDAFQELPPAGRSGDELHDLTAKKRTTRIQSLIEAIPKDGGSRHSLPPKFKLACHSRTDGFNDVYGRMAWDNLAPTITSGCNNPSKGRFLHPEEDRVITLREAAILQGFPRNYKFNVAHGRESIGLMIGNALPPPFIAAHGRALLEGLGYGEN